MHVDRYIFMLQTERFLNINFLLFFLKECPFENFLFLYYIIRRIWKGKEHEILRKMMKTQSHLLKKMEHHHHHHFQHDQKCVKLALCEFEHSSKLHVCVQVHVILCNARLFLKNAGWGLELRNWASVLILVSLCVNMSTHLKRWSPSSFLSHMASFSSSSCPAFFIVINSCVNFEGESDNGNLGAKSFLS